MKPPAILGTCLAAITLMACEPASNINETTGHIVELPEEVLAIVAPNQNLSAVRIMPQDGCYWSQWRGPVETTYLPLRTREGRMICTRVDEQEAPAPATTG